MHSDRYQVIRYVSLVPLLPWWTPEERASRQSPMWVMDSTFPFECSPEYRAEHARISDFTNAWFDETKAQVLGRWKEYGYEDV